MSNSSRSAFSLQLCNSWKELKCPQILNHSLSFVQTLIKPVLKVTGQPVTWVNISQTHIVNSMTSMKRSSRAGPMLAPHHTTPTPPPQPTLPAYNYNPKSYQSEINKIMTGSPCIIVSTLTDNGASIKMIF